MFFQCRKTWNYKLSKVKIVNLGQRTYVKVAYRDYNVLCETPWSVDDSHYTSLRAMILLHLGSSRLHTYMAPSTSDVDLRHHSLSH